MSEKNLFEIATRRKYLFTTRRGQASVQDLWDLSVEDLDTVWGALQRDLRASAEESLIQQPTKETEETTNKRDLVAYIVRTKQAESAARVAQKERRQKAARVRELLLQKQEQALAEKSAEELEKLLSELEPEGS